MKSSLPKVRRTVALESDDGQGSVLLVLAVSWFFTIGVRLMYPVMVPQIRETFGIDNTIAGFLFTAIMLTYAAGQFPSGLVADRIGERFILTVSVLGTIAGVTLLAVAPVFGVLLAGCVLFGLGSGLFASPSISVLSKVFPERAGTVHGVLFATGSVGTTVLPIVAGFTALHFGFRVGFALVIPVLVLTAIGIRTLVPETESEDRNDERPLPTVIRSVLDGVARRDTLLVAGALLAIVIVYQAISAFLPTYLIETKRLSHWTATMLFGLFFASGFFCQVGAGLLADRLPRRYILLAVSGLAATSLFGLTVVDGVLLIATLTTLLSSTAAFISVTNTYFVSVLPDDVQGGGVGLLRSVIIGIGATSPIFVGVLADAGRFDVAFRLLAVLLFVAVGVLAYSLATSRG